PPNKLVRIVASLHEPLEEQPPDDQNGHNHERNDKQLHQKTGTGGLDGRHGAVRRQWSFAAGSGHDVRPAERLKILEPRSEPAAVKEARCNCSILHLKRRRKICRSTRRYWRAPKRLTRSPPSLRAHRK